MTATIIPFPRDGFFRRDRLERMRIPGPIVEEYDDDSEALRAVKLLGPEYTVTPGIHRMWAVRRYVEVWT